MTTSGPPPFQNKIAVVTGATSPVASELCRALAAQGATVYATGPAGKDLDNLTSKRIIPMALDVTSRPAFVQVVDYINAHHDHIDLLINATSATVLANSADLSPEDWAEVLNTNVMGTVNGIELIYPAMVERKSGHVVNISSVAAESREAGATPFVTSKAFILGLDRSLAPEAKTFGVDLTLVLPGYLSPELFHQVKISGADSHAVKNAHTLSTASAEQIVAVILAGILKKKRRIFYPTIQARLLWHLAHWFPFLLTPLQKRFAKPWSK